jgi:leucyl-tRNA synthetase
LGRSDSLAYEPWPEYDRELIKEKEIELAVQVNGKIKDRIVVAADAGEEQELIKEKEIELAVQVNGKIKDRIVVAADAGEEQIKQKALSCKKVSAAMVGKEPRKIFVVKSRLVNIVV